MKAEELRALIREVLEEQGNKTKIKPGTKTPQALKMEIIETIKNIDVEKIDSGELYFLNQMISNLFELARKGNLVKGRVTIERAFDLMNKGVPQEEPQQTNEGHQMMGGIDDDDHEVHMAHSDRDWETSC